MYPMTTTETTDTLPVTILATSAAGATIQPTGRPAVTSTWRTLIAAVRQSDADLGTSYRAIVLRAISAEATRIGALRAHVHGTVTDSTHTGLATSACVCLEVDGYYLDSSHPAIRRRRDEGGTMVERLAIRELEERMDRADHLEGTDLRDLTAHDERVRAIAHRLGLLDVMGQLAI